MSVRIIRTEEKTKNKIKNSGIVPVILGGDLNAYSVALSFFEKYGVMSHVFARAKLGVTSDSAFIKLHIVENLDDVNAAVPALVKFAEKNHGVAPILIPAADWYMQMLQYARDTLVGYYYFHIPSFEIWRVVSSKSDFCRLAEKYGISYPKTEIIRKEIADEPSVSCVDSEKYRDGEGKVFVLKPSDSTEYWKHKFSGMRKVYYTRSEREARELSKKIFSAGYDGELLLQEKIGKGKSARSYVLTTYSDRLGVVRRAVFGKVVLEERGQTSGGNYSAILTTPLNDFTKKIINMLNSIGYRGIANIDILKSDNKFFVLELNARQGRSCDYLRGANFSIAELLVCDMEERKIKEKFTYPDLLWSAVAYRFVIRWCNKEDSSLCERLYREKMFFTPHDTEKNLKRKLYLFAHSVRWGRKHEREAQI